MKDFEKIKRSRLPESFFIEMLERMTVRKQDKYKDKIFYEFNGEIILEKDSKYKWLYVSNEKIWSVFESKTSYNYTEIQTLIKNVVEEHTKIRGYTPKIVLLPELCWVEEHTKIRGYTPSAI